MSKDEGLPRGEVEVEQAERRAVLVPHVAQKVWTAVARTLCVSIKA